MIYRSNNYGPFDRFCAKHPRFGIPNLMKIIVFGQVAVFLLDLLSQLIFRTSWLTYLEFVPMLILRGQVWRLVTWLFVPNSGNLFYLLLGCYFYYWIGSVLEREWGTAKFSMFYLCGAVLSMVLGMVLGVVQGELTHTISVMRLSYYLNLSIFLVLATIFGEMQVLLFFVVPVKMKWMALLDVVLILVDAVSYISAGYWMLALVPVASFLNYFIFTWSFWSMKLGFARRKADPQVINFKKAQKAVQKKAEETKGYLHKCAVCGITDTEAPDLEFRYCSKCDGYYCYCENHINNHVHIHED